MPTTSHILGVRRLVLLYLVSAAIGVGAAVAGSEPKAQGTLGLLSGLGKTIPVFRHYSTAQGLVQSAVNAIEFDRDGFVWIGTENGLSRFDGHHFTNFTHRLNQADSLQANYIRDLLRDRTGRLWVVTFNGIDRFKPQDSTFEHILTQAHLRRLGMRRVYHMVESKAGQFWVAGDKGVLRWRDAPGSAAKIAVYRINSQRLPAKEIVRVFALKSGMVLVADYRAGVLRYDAASDRFVPWLKVSAVSGDPRATSVRGVAELADGTLWLTTENGLLRVATDGRVLQRIWVGNTSWYPEQSARSIVLLNNVLWVSMRDAGLLRISPAGKLLQHIVHIPDTPYTLPSNSLGVIKADAAGQLWIASSSTGVILWSPKSEWTRRVDYRAGGKGPLSGAIVWSIFQDHTGDIWLGSDGGLDRWSFKRRQYSPVDAGKMSLSGVPATVFVIAGLGDDIWVGTAHGLSSINRNTGRRTDYFSKKSTATTLAADMITALYRDRANQLWIGYDKGLSRYDPTTHRFTHFTAQADSGNTCLLEISAISETVAGNILLGARNGVCKGDAAGHSFVHLRSLETETSPNASFLVTAFLVDGNTLWVGYSDNGLVQYSLSASRIIEHYNIEHDLPVNNVSSLLKDADGRLWLSSQTGMVVFDPKDQHAARLTGLDGLGGNEFNEGAFLRLSSGEFVFGTIKGLLIIDPSRFHQDQDSYVTKLVEVRSLFGNRSLNMNRSLSLLESDSALRLSFSLQQYYHPERARYEYRILGQHKAWIDIGNRSELFFGNFDVGRYQLQVRGKEFGRNWSLPARLNFTVVPPLWKSLPAQAGYLLLVLLMVSAFIRYRYVQSRERESMLIAVGEREEQLRLSLDATKQGVWSWNVHGDQIRFSRKKMLSDVKSTADPLLVEHWAQIDSRDRLNVIRAWNAHVFGLSDDYRCEYRRAGPDGEPIWISEHGRAQRRDERGMATSLVGTYRNITDIRATRRNMLLLAQAFEDTNEGVIMVDEQGRIAKINRATEHLSGYQTDELLGQPFSILYSDKQDGTDYDVILATVGASGRWQGEQWLKKCSGETLPIWLSISQTHHSEQDAPYFVVVFSDISERKAAEDALRCLVNYDTLTQLPNRALLHDRLQQALGNAKRQKWTMAVMFLDLDQFKQVNDSFGHAVGDKMLVTISDRLRSTLRDTDTISRLGGDEFVILIEQFHTLAAISAVVDKIRRCMDKPMQLEGHSLCASFSMGVALYPDDGQDAETLLKNADTAMYSAKAAGRNQMIFYAPHMNA